MELAKGKPLILVMKLELYDSPFHCDQFRCMKSKIEYYGSDFAIHETHTTTIKFSMRINCKN